MEASRKPADQTIAGFLAWQNRQIDEFEYLSGDIIEFVAESPIHSTIVTNIAVGLANRLRGTPCRALQRGTRLVASGIAALLPDVMMVCGRVTSDERPVSDPLVVFEVLSAATERRDRIAKNRIYRTIPSLRQYVMVMQDRLEIEAVIRSDRGWIHELSAGPDASVSLPAHGMNLSLAEIYATTDTLMRARSP